MKVIASSQSLSDATAAAARSVPDARGETNFASFVEMNSIKSDEAARFLKYVRACGGSLHTDCRTLAKLYDIWTALGREG